MENIVLYIVASTTTEMEFDLWHVIPDAVRHETNKSFIPRSNGQLGGKNQGVTNRDLMLPGPSVQLELPIGTNE